MTSLLNHVSVSGLEVMEVPILPSVPLKLPFKEGKRKICIEGNELFKSMV